MKIVHLTAHLGGGIGKAVSDLVVGSRIADDDIVHQVVSFEETKKPFFSERIENSGAELVVKPNEDELSHLIRSADIVQLEWWNHPATLKALCRHDFPPMRLLVWCHVSGLFNPIIPPKLMLKANRFLFTSACTYDAIEVKRLPTQHQKKLAVVSSCGGFDNLSKQRVAASGDLSVGYFGSLNFSKLHPDYVQFLNAVHLPGFNVRMIGDAVNKTSLELQCKKLGRPSILHFHGYSQDPGATLADINVLAYLLNPQHYGTTENALLEAMAMGIVPVVLDNPAERCIVEHMETGLIVRTKKEFKEAIEWLSDNLEERMRIGKNAANHVREKFNVENLVSFMNQHYRTVIKDKKENISFKSVFGELPADWFLSCQSHQSIFKKRLTNSQNCIGQYATHGLFEKTKGTVFHFLKYFTEDPKLHLWASNLQLNCMR